MACLGPLGVRRISAALLLLVVASDPCEHVVPRWRRMVAVIDRVGLAKCDELVLGQRLEHLAAAVTGQGEGRCHLASSFFISMISAVWLVMMF